ncbi:MAG: PrgI family protein [Candidatus Kerfeldbacteria bacterium]|nr:PrgI family protein [Candidatus Kerfeldbacteria bacterium]
MPNQYIVPQFIDVEDKILGPISVRQFIIFLVSAGLIAASYQILFKLANQTAAFIFTAVGIFVGTILFAFVRINGRPFHQFLLNLLQTFKNPRMRLWNNMVMERLQYRLEPPPPPPPPTKQPLTQTKLARLSLLVDTGGAFHEENDEVGFWGQDLHDVYANGKSSS